MTLKLNTLALGAAILALAACDTASKAWNGEAGASVDEGGFGNPTMTNMMAQMCRGHAKGYVVPDPIVAVDPSSPKGAPALRRGRVLCSGNLNGKYAQVIWGEYVGGATFEPRIEAEASDEG